MLALLLGTIGVGVWCLAVALGLGFSPALRLAPRNGAATRVALAFLLGSTVLSYGILGLGLLGGLRPLPVLGLLAVLSVPLVRDRRRIGEQLATMAGDVRAAYRGSPWPDRVLILLAGLLTSLSLLNPLFPVTSADALAYATSVPERFARDGRIQFYPDSYESTFVLLNEALHTIGYTLHLRPTGVWFEVAAQILLLFAAADCYRALRDDARRDSAYLFGAALLLMPLTQLMPFMVKAHLVELLAIVVGLTLVLEAPVKGGWAGATACVAVAIATKYIAGLGIVPLLAPLAAFGAWRQRPLPRVMPLAAVALLGVLLASPFYLRNFVWTGNPLFPASLPGLASPFQLQHHAAWIASLSHLDPGLGRGPSDLLLWWVRASILPVRGSAFYIGTFALSFLPLALLRPRPARVTGLALGFLAATLTLFFLSAHLERYFLAPIAAMAALATLGWDAQRERRKAVSWVGVALLLSLGLLVTLPLKVYGLLVHAPALLSRAQEDDVLARTTPWYADFRRIRAQVPPEAPILCMLRNCQYLTNHRREDVFFRLVEGSEGAARGSDPRAVWRGLREQGIRHVVAVEPAALTSDGRPPTVLGWLARCGGRVVYRNPMARSGTRDPRRVGTAVVVLIELSDALDDQAAGLVGPCGLPEAAG